MKNLKTSLFNNPETIYSGYDDFFKDEFVKPLGESEDLKKFPLLFDPVLKLEKVTLYWDLNRESGFHKFSFTTPDTSSYGITKLIDQLYQFLSLNSENELENPITALPVHIINKIAHIDILYGFSA